MTPNTFEIVEVLKFSSNIFLYISESKYDYVDLSISVFLKESSVVVSNDSPFKVFRSVF